MSGTSSPRRRWAFTLIELLTVVAIISLLISILVPSLSGARDAAKNAKTRSIMKAAGEGLELFRNENEQELRGNNYPPSTPGDDPTESGNNNSPGNEELCGAQWLVRYLLGKDLNGYVARRNVPVGAIGTTPGFEQEGWYDPNSALPRSGPYLPLNSAMLKSPKQLPGAPASADGDSPRFKNPVIIDNWDMPILYYAANTMYGQNPNANMTTYPGANPDKGIYAYVDNAFFTGLCTESGCAADYPPWLFRGDEHKLFYPGAWTSSPPATPAAWASQIADPAYRNSFPYIIMNKEAYQSTGGASKGTVIPYRRDSFLLLSPGKDGRFGTDDDIWNFK